MKEFFNKIKINKEKLGSYLPDILLFVIFLFLFLHMDVVVRFFDPTAVSLSADYISIITLSLLFFFLGASVIKFTMLLQWPTLDKLLEKYFDLNLNFLTPWQKIKLSLSVYFFLFFLYILIVINLL
jgi:hypothetical protein